KRIIAPRFFAGVISVPLLTIIFSSLAVFGGYFVGVGLLGVDDGAFWSQIQSKIDFNDDLLNGLLKSFVFGVIVSWLAVFEGYDTVPTSSGISHATTRTVVHSAIAILAVDFILTALML
ncbi:MAG: ABC transporter permease, partial [Methylococcales bacterium]|nr:ABC transporter permease [Methylococcales bacterium]